MDQNQAEPQVIEQAGSIDVQQPAEPSPPQEQNPQSNQPGEYPNLPADFNEPLTATTTTAQLSVAPLTFAAAQRASRGMLAVLDSMAGGFSVVTTLPVILGVVIRDVAPIFQSVDQIRVEMRQSKLQAMHAIYVGLDPVVARYVK